MRHRRQIPVTSSDNKRRHAIQQRNEFLGINTRALPKTVAKTFMFMLFGTLCNVNDYGGIEAVRNAGYTIIEM